MLTECMDCNRMDHVYINQGYLDQTAEELNIKIFALWLGNLMMLTWFRDENASSGKFVFNFISLVSWK